MRLVLLALTFLVTTNCIGQVNSELEKRNGFKDIKLGSHVDSIKGALPGKEFIERKEFPAQWYTVEHEDYSKIGDVSIKNIELKTYKGLIYEIMVKTARDVKVMQGLEKAYGKATFTVRTESWYWNSENITLSLKGYPKYTLLVYKSVPVIKMMYADKGKKIEKVAEDF